MIYIVSYCVLGIISTAMVLDGALERKPFTSVLGLVIFLCTVGLI